jgi:hypothetical protein
VAVTDVLVIDADSHVIEPPSFRRCCRSAGGETRPISSGMSRSGSCGGTSASMPFRRRYSSTMRGLDSDACRGI